LGAAVAFKEKIQADRLSGSRSQRLEGLNPLRTEHGDPLMNSPLDEGAIPSTSTTCSANQEDEDLEVETYIYKDSRLVRVTD